MPRPFAPGMLSVVAAIVATTAAANGIEHQVHGSLAQGFVLSEGNNLDGDSKHGSFAYYEAALNGTVRPLPDLLLSAQVLARDAGATDDGKPRLDFAFLDYAFLNRPGTSAGVRVGRVKNAFGLYNDTRDVVFARPGILMPQSIYYDNTGARALLFASDGAQVYGATTLGPHYLSFVGGFAPDRRMDPAQEARSFGSLAQSGDGHLNDFYFARLQDERERWTAALSFLHGDLAYEPDPGNPMSFDIGFRMYVASLRYNTPRFSVTSEYGLTQADTTFSFGGPPVQSKGTSDGAYLQGDYFLTDQWTLRARWDSSFADRNHRSGSTSAACANNGTSVDSHLCYAHDFSVGANWDSGAHWGAWAEYHLIDGLSTASTRDNGPTLDPHWSVLALMAAFRF